MPDKPHAWFALPGHAVVTLEGRDSVAFSQAQFMSDVNSLAAGDWHWSGWLTPKGRVVALFALFKRDAEAVWLVLPDADAGAFAEALRRFVFRSKLAIAVREDLAVSGTFVAASHGNVILDMSAQGGPRTLRIGDRAAEDPSSVARWLESDLLHGLPRLPPSQAAQWTPQQLSLERLRAFSVKKGCYPGQEIVARTHFLGQAKRGLVLLEGDRPVPAGDEVQVDGAAHGSIVSAAGRLALAVLPLARVAEADVRAGETVLQERPLLPGLARPA